MKQNTSLFLHLKKREENTKKETEKSSFSVKMIN